jgi:UDP-2,3-diacylglucosamine hydrolase
MEPVSVPNRQTSIPDRLTRRYFIADVHLDGRDTPQALKFRQFLQRLASENAEFVSELYVLGDLFAFWSEDHPPLLALYQKDLAALEAAGAAGVRIFLIFGNRDFTYRKYPSRRWRATVLGDCQQIVLSDHRPVWLEHGDLLCTSDHAYLRFRKLIRSWPARLALRLLPWFLASRAIARIRRKAKHEKRLKPPAAFDINPDVARARLEEKFCRILLCGHTHHPKALDLGAGYRLLVLPAWCETPGGYWDDGQQALRPFSFGQEETLEQPQ